MIKYLGTITLLSVALGAAVQETQAQVRTGNFGIGGQIGDPSGLTFKYYSPGGAAFGSDAYDFLLAWDFEGDDDEIFVNIHAIYDRPLSTAPVNFFLGPGFFVGVIDTGDGDDAYGGFSGNFGLNYFIERFELFVQLTPRLVLLPETEGDLGGGLGVRFYL